MPKRRKPAKPKAPLEGDLPQNPEFQEFVEFTKKLVQVPKEKVDERLAEERERKKNAS